MELLLDRFLNPQYTQAPSPNNNKDDGLPHNNSKEWEKSSAKRDTSGNDPYQHFAAMLMNATQIELGRKFVLKMPMSVDFSHLCVCVFFICPGLNIVYEYDTSFCDRIGLTELIHHP